MSAWSANPDAGPILLDDDDVPELEADPEEEDDPGAEDGAQCGQSPQPALDAVRMVGPGAPPPLIALLAGTDDAREHAARALGSIACDCGGADGAKGIATRALSNTACEPTLRASGGGGRTVKMERRLQWSNRVSA